MGNRNWRDLSSVHFLFAVFCGSSPWLQISSQQDIRRARGWGDIRNEQRSCAETSQSVRRGGRRYDRAPVWATFSVVHEQLVSAQTDAERIAQPAREEQDTSVTGGGIHTRGWTMHPRLDKSDAEATVLAETLVPHGAGACAWEVGWRSVGLLGQGSMGNVYTARDRLKNEDVAIKVLRQDLLFSALAEERFSLKPGFPAASRIPTSGAASRERGRVSGEHYYLSMERLKGHNLRQRVRGIWRGRIARSA